MSPNSFRIAIIDSGVENIKDYIGASVVADDVTDEYIISADFNDQNGHGTIVTNIIEAQVGNAQLYILKVFGDEEEIDSNKLIFALNYLHNHIKPNIIHLSLGISFCEDIKALRESCQSLVDDGTIIVAAFDNNGALSYPAAFPFVIGVESNTKLIKTSEYFYLQNSPINIAAIGVAQRLKGRGSRYFDVVGSSFSAPYITSLIANKIINGEVTADNKSVLSMLKSGAKKIYEADDLLPIKKPFKINRAIIFPLNKEINTVLRYSSHLTFDLYGVYDLKFLNNVGRNISIEKGKSIKVGVLESIPWDADFDTVVLGHLKELNDISHKDYTGYIVKHCIEYRKNIYSFDSLSSEHQELFRAAGLCYYTPKITKRNVPICYEGKMRQIGKPILCVAGTSSKQGKFSLQMKLKELMSQHINVGLMSTEPSGYLLGADMVFPMGYNSTIDLDKDDQYIPAINCAIGSIEDLGVDLILTGLQSQTIPMQLCNQKDMVLFNHYYLLATNPDAAILLINVFDDFDYISRTICYLENIIVCDVIALVLFPIKRTFKWNTLGDLSVRYDEETLQKIKENICKHFHRDTYILDNEKDMNELCLSCLKHFK